MASLPITAFDDRLFFGDDDPGRGAEALLLESLSPGQREQYSRVACFFVTGASGARYRIRYGRTHNIDVIGRDGKVRGTLCGLPIGEMPTQDVLLGQKLCLETDDRAFSRIARHSPLACKERVLPAVPHTWRDLLPTRGAPDPFRVNVLLCVLNTALAADQVLRGHPYAGIPNALAVFAIAFLTCKMRAVQRRWIVPRRHRFPPT